MQPAAPWTRHRRPSRWRPVRWRSSPRPRTGGRGFSCMSARTSPGLPLDTASCAWVRVAAVANTSCPNDFTKSSSCIELKASSSMISTRSAWGFGAGSACSVGCVGYAGYNVRQQPYLTLIAVQGETVVTPDGSSVELSCSIFLS